MNNILTLVKMSLINSYRGQAGKGKRKISKSLLGVLILIWFVPMIMFTTEITKAAYGVMNAFNQGDVIIVFGLLVVSMVVFIFGIFYTIGSYYMSKDITTYLAMPLKSYEITSARFLTVLIYEYLTMLLFFLPIIIGYGIAAAQGIGYYLLAVPIFILLPILPLSLASIIVMFIMSFSKKAMNKDRFTMIASILGIGIGISFNIGFQTLARSVDDSTALQQLIIEGKVSLAESIAKYFPGIINASKALTEYNILHLLIFILIAAAAFVLFMLVAKALYFKGVLGISQQVARREFDADKTNGFTAASPVKTYLLKELRIIFRTPIYFMNLVLIDILMPVMIIVSMIFATGSTDLGAILDLFKGSVSNGILITGSFILFIFFSSMNGITATTISREGRQLYIMKFIPMEYKAQLNAKLLSGMMVSMGGMIVTLVVIVVLLKISLTTAVLMFLAGTNAVVLTRLTGLFIDGLKPKLKWDNEVKAVKQNMNLVLNMLIGMGVAGLAVVFLIFVSTSLFVNILVFIAAVLAVNIGIYKLLQNKFPGMIKRIE